MATQASEIGTVSQARTGCPSNWPRDVAADTNPPIPQAATTHRANGEENVSATCASDNPAAAAAPTTIATTHPGAPA